MARAEAEARLADFKHAAAARRIDAAVRTAYDQWAAAATPVPIGQDTPVPPSPQ